MTDKHNEPGDMEFNLDYLCHPGCIAQECVAEQLHYRRLDRARIEQLEAALQTLCYHWDQMLNNLDDGEEFEAREAARAALGQEKAE